MSERLRKRVAIVIGGGRGIGAAIAEAFAAEGAQLVIASRTERELAAVAARCQSHGVPCLTHVADVSVLAEIRTLVRRALDHFGHIDVLVNAAGVYGPIGPLVDVDLEEWTEAVRTNLFGTLYACHEVLPSMIRGRAGSIINFSGGGAAAPLPRFSAYGVSKAAIVRLTETLAEEVAEHGVRVNAIAPGAVDTKLQDDVLLAGKRAGPLYTRIRDLRESGAGGTPVQVPASLAVFLASSESQGLTGRLISAPHDRWKDWDQAKIEALAGTPWYTLRRIDPFTINALKDSPV